MKKLYWQIFTLIIDLFWKAILVLHFINIKNTNLKPLEVIKDNLDGFTTHEIAISAKQQPYNNSIDILNVNISY